ncbi:hypothetical protein ScPMuIL_018376 [Solemya velum]
MDSQRQISNDSTSNEFGEVSKISRTSLLSRSRIWTVIFGLLFLAVIGLLAGFIGVFLHSLPLHCSQPPVEAGSLRDTVCLDCALLQNEQTVRMDRTPGEIVFVEKHNIAGESKCCIDPVSALQRLLEVYPAERQRVSIGAVTDCETKGGEQSESGVQPRSEATAAHMFLDLDSLWDGVQGLEWTVGRDDVGFRTPDIIYRPGGIGGGRLVIPRDGYYYVYSSFRFDSYYNRTLQRRGQNDAIVSHAIRRNSIAAINEMLQFGKVQVLAGTMKESYLSSNMKLRKGDELFVYVSDISLIYYFQMSNVFGLYEV